MSDFDDRLPDAGDPDGLPPGDAPETNRPEAHERPEDPAGTRPRHEADDLLPAEQPALKGRTVTVDSTAVEEGEPVADEGDLLPEKVAAAGALGSYRPKETRHTPRFQFLFGALFALGIAAVAGIVALAVSGKPDRPFQRAWSDWRPTSSDPAAEIAQHVGQRYHKDDGEQLVLVKGGPLQVSDTPLKIVVTQGGNYYPVDGKGVLYQLCGLGGKDCRIGGKPSKERGTLLRRESLELSLYTFRYTDADNVVAIFPPTVDPKTGKVRSRQDIAVFLQRRDVEEQLKRPLDTTLTETPPRVSTIFQSPDIGSVESIMSARDFKFSFQSAGTDGAYIVLKPAG